MSATCGRPTGAARTYDVAGRPRRYRRDVDVELARQQWADGHRRLDEVRADRGRHERLLAQVEVVHAELRRRVGQTFTLGELAAVYESADDWAREAVLDADPEPDAAHEVSIVGDAAFHVYARGATDYAP